MRRRAIARGIVDLMSRSAGAPAASAPADAEPPARERSVAGPKDRAKGEPRGDGKGGAKGEETGPLEVPLDAIVPNRRQPRESFEEEALEELAASIREHGILQPLLVRPLGDGRYELIAGERRWRAAQRAGLATVPVLTRSATGQAALEMALVENVQREDITPLECARAYRALIDEFGMTQEQVAAKVGKSRAAVANALRLLKLPAPILEGLQKGLVTEGHARALLMLEQEKDQLALFEAIVSEGLSVRQAEERARGAGPPARRREGRVRPPEELDPNWIALQEGLSTYFGTSVRIKRGETGGKLIVDFYSDDDLQRILDVLGISL